MKHWCWATFLLLLILELLGALRMSPEDEGGGHGRGGGEGGGRGERRMREEEQLCTSVLGPMA